MIVMHSMRDYDAERAAGRMAVQAAAGALISITGQACNDIVMCAAPREWDDTLQVSPSGEGPTLREKQYWHVGGSQTQMTGSHLQRADELGQGGPCPRCHFCSPQRVMRTLFCWLRFAQNLTACVLGGLLCSWAPQQHFGQDSWVSPNHSLPPQFSYVHVLKAYSESAVMLGDAPPPLTSVHCRAAQSGCTMQVEAAWLP